MDKFEGIVRSGLLLATLSACAGRQEGAHGPDRDHASFLQFQREVIPVLEARCGVGCHGVAADRYKEWMGRATNATFFYFPIDPASGEVPPDPALRRMAFQVTRGAWHPPGQQPDEHAEPILRIDPQAAPEYSHLLLAPLQGGGLQHHGVEVFQSPADPDYQTLYRWVAQQIDLDRGAHAPPPPSLAEVFFRDQVIGVMERNGCFTASCHGANVFNDLKLIRPLPQASPDAPPRLSPRMLAADRAQALGQVSRFVNLGGDLRLSRLLVKNLPVLAGGVHQRGGNLQFFSGPEDPDVHTLLRWMQMERDALAARLTAGGRPIPPADLGREQGIVFLRGPRHAPRQPWEFDGFYPTTQALLLPAGQDRPIPIVDEPGVEIQALDVRYDARAVAFSMRRSADRGFRIFQVSLSPDLRPVPGSLQQLSFGPERTEDGTLIQHVDPVYTPRWTPRPDPQLDAALDRVGLAYAANTAGGHVQSEPWGLLGEADEHNPDPGALLDSRRFEAPGTFTGRRLYLLAGPMKGAWRTVRLHAPGGRLVLDRPLPGPADARTVYMIEPREPRFAPSYDIYWFLPGRYDQSNRRLTFSNAQERRPTLRTTGEVMFTSVRNRGWQADRPVFNGAIYRVQAGGWDYHIHGGNRSRYPLYLDARELPQGLEIRLAADPRNHWSAGTLLLADHGFGVNIEDHNPVDDLPYQEGGRRPPSGSQRFLPSQYPVFAERGPHGVTHTGVSPGGAFRDPFPLPDGTVLVAHTPRPLDHLRRDADPDWDLYRLRWPGQRLQQQDGQGAAPAALERIAGASTPFAAEFNPRPLIVRLKEKSVTHQKFAPRTDGLRPAPVDGVLRLPDERRPAEIECYDFPLLQSFLENFAPVGPRNFRESELRFVRIVQQLPSRRADVSPTTPGGPDPDPFARPVSLGIHERQVVVAEVPLEPDGSFYAEVPAQVPLLMQGLNADRMAVVSMNRWFYLHPGEKLTFSIPRSIYTTRCSGCHAALTGDRAEALGPVDVVSAASLVMATWSEGDRARRRPFVGRPIAIDFPRDIQPILDRRCVSCHGADHRAAGLDLRGAADGAYSVAYRSLLQLEQPGSGDFANRRYVDERGALSTRSHLIEVLTGREYAAPRQLAAPGQAHVSTLTEEELLMLIRWIDLGATYHGGRP